MSLTTEDFVQIDFITDQHTLSIVIHSDGLSIGAWHSIVKTLAEDEILVGFDAYNAKQTSFSYTPDAFHAIRVSHVYEDFIPKFEERYNKDYAKDTITV